MFMILCLARASAGSEQSIRNIRTQGARQSQTAVPLFQGFCMHIKSIVCAFRTVAAVSCASFLLVNSSNVLAAPAEASRCDFSTPLPERAFACNAALARTINFGNMLETPREGIQGNAFTEEYAKKSKEAGFTAVRIPIRWDARAGYQPPYEIQKKFFDRMDYIVDYVHKQGLAVIIDMHHFVGMTMDPDAELPRYLGVWRQVAEHYKNAPATVMFEVLNEPHGLLGPDRWQKAFDAVLPIIRESNPHRTLIVGGSEWNSASAIETIQLPASDQNLIATFHFYEPFHLTHQGAEWVSGSSAWLGKKWSEDDKNLIDNAFDRVNGWAKENKRPLFMGEFGVYSKADHESRLIWTRYVRKAAEARNISWAYWELMSSFGILDPRTFVWRKDLLETLIEPKP
jgi:endoglucanase